MVKSHKANREMSMALSALSALHSSMGKALALQAEVRWGLEGNGLLHLLE